MSHYKIAFGFHPTAKDDAVEQEVYNRVRQNAEAFLYAKGIHAGNARAAK